MSTDAYREAVETSREKQAALKFLTKLDSRYDGLHRSLMHSKGMGQDLYPETVVGMYRLALNRKDTKPTAAFDAAVAKGVAFATTHGSTSGNGKAGVSGSESRASSDDNPHAKKKCYACQGKGYIASDPSCPKYDASKRKKKKGGGQAMSPEHLKLIQDATNVLATLEDGEGYCTLCTDEVTNAECIEGNLVAWAAKNNILRAHDILPDNQANVSVFHNQALLTNLRVADRVVTVSGISDYDRRSSNSWSGGSVCILPS